jgi:hypothetical protein
MINGCVMLRVQQMNDAPPFGYGTPAGRLTHLLKESQSGRLLVFYLSFEIGSRTQPTWTTLALV